MLEEKRFLCQLDRKELHQNPKLRLRSRRVPSPNPNPLTVDPGIVRPTIIRPTQMTRPDTTMSRQPIRSFPAGRFR